MPNNLRYFTIFLAIVVVCALVGGFFLWQKFVLQSNYVYTLAEFVQKQQTFSPYTKYEPSFAIDKARGKVHYVFKAMDDNDLWQIWIATTDIEGNGWQAQQQTNSPENKQRPAIAYDPKEDMLYCFYRTGSELGAVEKITRRLLLANKKPDEEKWREERELIGDNGIDDTVSVAFDLARRQLILAYTKNNQITTGRLFLDNGSFRETVHTNTAEMNFIPNMVYDETSDTIYLVFPRARRAGRFDNKDLWLAKVSGDGTDYEETRLTETSYDNTWPFVTLDLPRQKLYVSYSAFSEPITYSEFGIAQIKEQLTLARVSLDGSDWELFPELKGFRIYGINSESGVLYGTKYEDSQSHYFAVYDAAQKELKKQRIPRGDGLTYYDAAYRQLDSETGRLFGAQQVCRGAGERGIECQIWTYTGRVLDGKKSTRTAQTKAEMAPVEPRQLPDFKVVSTRTFSNKITINTNRKLSMPLELRVTSIGQEVVWQPSQLNQVDQDKGIELHFPTPLFSYEVAFKICALSDPKEPLCLEDTISYSVPGDVGQVHTEERIFEGTDFTISVPFGWLATQMPGVVVAITNVNEAHPQGSSANLINFKSYIAVAPGQTQGRTLEELAGLAEAEVLNAIPSTIIGDRSDGVIDGVPAKFVEMNLTQSDVDFAVLLTTVAKEDKYFVISANTTQDRWQEYKDLFYQTARSFKFK